MVWDPGSIKRLSRFAQMESADPEPQDGAMMTVETYNWSEIDYEVSLIEVQVSADLHNMTPQEAMMHIDRAIGNETETGPLSRTQFKQQGTTWCLYGRFGRGKFAAEYVDLKNPAAAAALAEQECMQHAESGTL